MKTLYCTLVMLVVGVVLTAGAEARPPFWDDQINSPQRFKVLNEFNGEAVLDRETGLVWERSPSPVAFPWVTAFIVCFPKTVGGRLGWRVPTIEELASLVDPNNPGGNPDLPPNHPFANVQPSTYWSATTVVFDPASAWDVSFAAGNVGVSNKSNSSRVWCVRGGQGHDAY